MKDEFDHRLGEGKRNTEAVKRDLRELYVFLFNGREREWDAHRKKWGEPEEIFDTTAAEASLEFTGDLFQYATPSTQPWVEFEVGSAVPEENEQDVLDLVEAREKHLADAIASSNYYDRGPEIFQEASLGVIACNIERPSLTSAIEFEPVPLSELHMTVGAQGVEDRFRCKPVWTRDIMRLFPDYKPSTKMKKKLENHGTCMVKWGYWRDYKDPADPKWYHVAKVDDELAFEGELGREGSCPLIIGRFNPIPRVPHGRGPAWMMLPEIRSIDALRRMIMENLDRTVDPAVTYTRDGLLDLSDGVEAGMAYPSMPGSEVNEIGGQGNLDYGLFSLDDMRAIIRRGFYRKQEQRGDTPPSASQFVGEQSDMLARMGKPGSAVFYEFVRSLLQRVESLEIRDRGLAEQIMSGGDVVKVRPISPMERAQAQEEVAEAESIMTTAMNVVGPEQAALLIDGPSTMGAITDKLGNKLVRFRSNEQIQEIVQGANAPA